MSPADSKNDEREILFEFRTLGNQVRVAAIDADSGTEVIIIAPVSASQAEMQRIASAKLFRQLAKQVDQ
jgi:Domain of unknown function (DUF6898)